MERPKTIVCFGDSLTEASIGSSYVDLLRARLDGARVVNAGVNGDTTLNLLRRLERDVVPHRPDVVVLLVGLNDMGTAYGEPAIRRYYRGLKGVWVELTPPRFARAYRRLIADLRARTGARLLLCTPTTLGEDPDDPYQHLVDAYANVVRALAHEERLALVDLRAAFLMAMRADPRPGPPYHIWTPLIDWSAIALLRTSHEALGVRRGFRLLCDGVHLAGAGAALVAEMLLPALREAVREPGLERVDEGGPCAA